MCHFGKAGMAAHKHLVEIRVDDASQYSLGQEIGIADVLDCPMPPLLPGQPLA